MVQKINRDLFADVKRIPLSLHPLWTKVFFEKDEKKIIEKYLKKDLEIRKKGLPLHPLSKASSLRSKKIEILDC